MTSLQQAAQELLAKYATNSTSIPVYMFGELRKALEAELSQSVEPVAVFHGCVDSGEHGAFNLDMLKMIPRGADLYLHPPQPQTAPLVVPKGCVLSDQGKVK